MKHLNALGMSVAAMQDPFESVDPGAFNPLNAPATSPNPFTGDINHVLPQDDNPDNPQSVNVAISNGSVVSTAVPASKPNNTLLLIAAAVAVYFLFLKK